ncbi:DegT/DnrJ/EryC1/StrS family aminotransferase [Myxococcus vastator]|uniref:DegT/DnrJ/EryC1/StrS family aminotransferase n=1 Tax=Myxococcus vastator TaxID=2709664 RepID=UPI0013D0A009|nr:aminotransferase class I/II-fold pyridoxal phosphate-dependent enzyme [Myxococcus vastator]
MTGDSSIPPSFHQRDASDATYLSAFLHRDLSGTGDVVLAYEAALRSWFGAAAAVSVSSGSAAVMVALGALGLRPGDEVVVPPTAPLCTVYPILAMGGVPVFCDTREDGFGLDLDDLESVVGPRTRAIIEVPMWGYPTPLIPLRAFADDLRLPLVLDLAHGHGIRLSGRPLWTYGHLATFSTHESKFLSTGEGGFILTDDADLAKAARRFSRRGGLNGRHLGLSLTLCGLQAALGLRRLRLLNEHLRVRGQNARHILKQLTQPQLQELPVTSGGEPNYYFLVLRHRGGSAHDLIEQLAAQGIPSDIRRYRCRPLYEFPILSAYRHPCENARRLLGSMTTIPVHPSLTTTELDRIAAAINHVSRL